MLRGIGTVLTRRFSIRRSGVATSASLRRSLNTSSLSIISLLVSVRSRFRIRIPSRRVRGVGAINSLMSCVRTGSWFTLIFSRLVFRESFLQPLFILLGGIRGLRV